MTLSPDNKLQHFLRLNPDVLAYLVMWRRLFIIFGISFGILICIVIRFLTE